MEYPKWDWAVFLTGLLQFGLGWVVIGWAWSIWWGVRMFQDAQSRKEREQSQQHHESISIENNGVVILPSQESLGVQENQENQRDLQSQENHENHENQENQENLENQENQENPTINTLDSSLDSNLPSSLQKQLDSPPNAEKDSNE